MIAIGIALGPERLVAVMSGGLRLETTETADVSQLFADLKKTAGVARARVSVALLPPLVDVRRVRLPPMRNHEGRRVLERDASRYFVGVREPQVVATDGSLAAAAAARFLEEIETAVSSVGWKLSVVAPAHVAWALCLPDGRHAIAKVGEWLEVRRGRISDRGHLRPNDATGPDAGIDPYFAAAEQVIHARTMHLRSLPERARLQRSEQRRSWVLLAAAAVCLVTSAVLDYWGLERELDDLRVRRAAIASHVVAAMRTRDSASALSGVASAIDNLGASKRHWSAFFADLADYLPRDAYLTGVEARGDSVVVVGVARDAAGVLLGLEQMPALVAVHAAGPIRQEISTSGAVHEHFRFSARWDEARKDQSP